MRLLLPAVVLLSIIAHACAGSENEPSAPASTPSERFAIVTLSWSGARSAADPAVLPDTALAQAYFVEHAAGERSALLDFLHVPAATVAFDAGIAVDTCVVLHPDAPSPAVLLDAGELTVETEDGESFLDSSYIPDGYMQVSGLAYEGLVTAHGTLVLAADGSDEVGPFAVTLSPPPAVRLLAVGGAAVVRGRVELDPARTDARGLVIAWEAPDAPYDGVLADDVAVITYERRAFGDAWFVACAVRDDGRFVIPAPALHGLGDLGAATAGAADTSSDTTDRVVVRRLSGASFSAPGIPDGLALAIAEDAAYVE